MSANPDPGFGAVSSLDAFERVISADFLTITSTCKRCGTTLSGTASDGLAERELEHLKTCDQAAKRPVASVK
jgi:hypothetical protein